MTLRLRKPVRVSTLLLRLLSCEFALFNCVWKEEYGPVKSGISTMDAASALPAAAIPILRNSRLVVFDNKAQKLLGLVLF